VTGKRGLGSVLEGRRGRSRRTIEIGGGEGGEHGSKAGMPCSSLAEPDRMHFDSNDVS